MPRLSTPAFWVVVITLLISPMAWAQEPTLGERLLPKSTVGALLVTHPKQLSDHWKETQLGQLTNDPVMKPFTEDLRRQFQDRWARIRDRLGLRLEDLKGVPGGEMAVALIAPTKDKAAVALVLDVTDHVPQAQGLLDKVTANLIKKGAKQKRETVEGTTVIVFDLPETRESSATRAVYFLSGSLLGASDDQSVIEGVLKRKLGQAAPGDSLADLPAFGAVMNRCRQDAKAMPQVRWFVEPFGYVEAVRAATPEEKRRKGVTVLDVLRDQGFTAVEGVGGFVDLKVDGYEVLHRTAVFAPKPYKPAPAPYENKVSMNMFVLPNSDQFALPAWVPNDIAGCTTFNWDILGAFDNLGPTFDQLVGEGETGVWDDVLGSLKDDPNGPQIDLRSELIAHLGQRVTTIRDYRLPITTTSERLLFAIEARNEAAVAAGIKKMLQDDPTIERREFEGLDIWETVEEETHAIPAAPLVDLPTLGSKKKQPSKTGRRPLVEEEDEEEPRLLPHAAVTVVNGHLLVASHYDFLIEVLTKAKQPDPLGESMDYRVVDGVMKQLGAGANCVRSFSRTDETYRPTYELIRMGKMPESQAMLGRILNALLGPRKKGAVRKQKVDGAKMPDYQVVRRYLGPAGTFGTTEENGWFIVGFTLKK